MLFIYGLSWMVSKNSNKNNPLKKYSKEAESTGSLIHKLESRGLHIPCEKTAQNSLTFIGYYRLMGYFYPFYKVTAERKPKVIEPKTFKENTSFSDIIDLYEFDRKFRLLIIEEIQKIEIGLRTALSEHMSGKYGPHWFMNLAILTEDYGYDGFFERIRAAKEVFISHYHDTYSFPKYPPSWMIAEVLTFGTWSTMYGNLLSVDQKAIAKKFDINSIDVMQSWFHSLSHLRNLCAHHNRVWNRNIHLFIPKDTALLKSHMQRKNTLYVRLCVLKYLSDQVSVCDGFRGRIRSLLDSAPVIVSENKMGFIHNWEETPLWRPKPKPSSDKVRERLRAKRRR